MTTKESGSPVPTGFASKVLAPLALLFLLLAASGCPTKGSGSGPPIKDAASIQPDLLYAKEAVLNYGGTQVDVTMERIAKGDTIQFVLVAHGQTLETETYRLTETDFSLVSIDETFEPPLPLLKFPMKVTDSWEWKGALKVGAIQHKSQAKIASREEKLIIGKRDPFTLRVDVQLEIDSGASNPAKRNLTFWFERGRGIVQREIGTATQRKPAE